MSFSSTRQLPSAIRAAQYLLFFNAAIWLMLGAISLLRMSQNTSESSLTYWIIAFLMAGNAGMLLLCGWGLGTGRRWFYLITLAVMAINIILTVTDQFGWLDFLTLIIDVGIVVLLIISRIQFSRITEIT